MSMRLTKDYRLTVVAKLLQHRFADADQEMAAAERALATQVYCDVYPPKVRQLMEDLPSGFFERITKLRVQFGTEVTELELPAARMAAEKHRGYRTMFAQYEDNQPMFQTWLDFSRRKTDLAQLRKAAEAPAWAVLDSVSTLERLKAVWPEVVPFLPPTNPGSPTRALALPMESVNLLFNLKKEK